MNWYRAAEILVCMGFGYMLGALGMWPTAVILCCFWGFTFSTLDMRMKP